MRWLIDASAARHSGALTHHRGMLPALAAGLQGDACTVLASPDLARALGDLRGCDVELLDVSEGLARLLALNGTVRRRASQPGVDAAAFAQYAPLLLRTPYLLRVTDAHMVARGDRARLDDHYGRGGRLAWTVKDLAFRRSARAAAAILCSTQATADQLRETLPEADPAKIHVAPYGPSPLAWTEARHRAPGRRRLLTMHVSPRKNVEVILRALSLPELRWWTLTVLADLDEPPDRYTAYLAGLVRSLGLDRRVVSAGYRKDPAELVGLLLDHDILVSTSRIETWNHTVIEGMALGMPVIASDIPTHQEVTGGGAWLVDGDSPEQLAAAVVAIEAGEDVRDRLDRARTVVGSYSWESYAAAVLRLLREIA